MANGKCEPRGSRLGRAAAVAACGGTRKGGSRETRRDWIDIRVAQLVRLPLPHPHLSGAFLARVPATYACRVPPMANRSKFQRNRAPANMQYRALPLPRSFLFRKNRQSSITFFIRFHMKIIMAMYILMEEYFYIKEPRLFFDIFLFYAIIFPDKNRTSFNWSIFYFSLCINTLFIYFS